MDVTKVREGKGSGVVDVYDKKKGEGVMMYVSQNEGREKGVE